MPWSPKTNQQLIRQRRGGLEPTGPNRRQYCDRKWREIRQRVLIRDVVCQSCRVKPATCVHHIQAVVEGGSDAMSNLEGLCESCHNRRSGSESEAFQQRWYQ